MQAKIQFSHYVAHFLLLPQSFGSDKAEASSYLFHDCKLKITVFVIQKLMFVCFFLTFLCNIFVTLVCAILGTFLVMEYVVTECYGNILMWLEEYIRKPCPCNVYPLEPQFYIVKLGFAGVYLFLAHLSRRLTGELIG